MHMRTILGTAALIILPGLLHAGPVADAEAALRGAYGHYRTALFQQLGFRALMAILL